MTSKTSKIMKSETRALTIQIAHWLGLVIRATSRDLADWTGADREAVRYALKRARKRGTMARVDGSWILTGFVPADGSPVEAKPAPIKVKTASCDVPEGTIERSDLTTSPDRPECPIVTPGRKRRSLRSLPKCRDSKPKNRKGTIAERGFWHSKRAAVAVNAPLTLQGEIVARVKIARDHDAWIPVTDSELLAYLETASAHNARTVIQWGRWTRNDRGAVWSGGEYETIAPNGSTIPNDPDEIPPSAMAIALTVDATRSALEDRDAGALADALVSEALAML